MNHTENVLALDVADLAASKVPGAFRIVDSKRLAFNCPCGCGDYFSLPITGAGWSWDGNSTMPTITPSIRQLNHCKWHGHLKAGVWMPCGDSGQ